MLVHYKVEKKFDNIVIYKRIKEFICSKIFNHSGILQKVAFKHIIPQVKNRSKDIFEITVLKNILKEIQNKLNSGGDLSKNFDINIIFEKKNEIDIDALLKKEKIALKIGLADNMNNYSHN